MSLNWKEIDLILSELSPAGCHIQGIRQPNFRSLVLELYRPGDAWSLLVHLGTDGCRMHRLTDKPSYPKVTQRFAEFLRARVRGGRITGVRQIPGDRIVLFTVSREEETTKLWFRLWGAASNIIATEADGTILDAYFRRPKKGEESGGRYDPEADEPAAVKPGGKIFSVRPHPPEVSFNAFIEAEYREKEEAALKTRLLLALESRFKSREAKLYSILGTLRTRREDYSGIERYRKFGDLIMANLHTARKGDEWLKALDYDSDETEIDIKLDTALSPYENAESYYQKYKKAKNGQAVVDEEIDNLENTLRRLQRRREELKTEGDIAVLEAELRKEKPAGGGEKEKGSPPGLTFESNGFRILVGRTAAENDELLRRHVRGNDYWLHARDYPGGHVFIKGKPGKSVPLETLLDAGNLAVFYSKARSSGGAELYYTQVKHLRRAKGEKIGTVLPTHEKNLSVKLDPARLERLDGEK